MNVTQIKELTNSLWMFENPFERTYIIQTLSGDVLIGYFDNIKMLKTALKDPDIESVFTPLNIVKESCVERLSNDKNQLVPCPKGKGISNNDIASYRYLFIDIDATDGMPTKHSKKKDDVSQEHHEKVIALGKEVIGYLKTRGFPAPIFNDSGNGVHILYYIDLPVTKQSQQLIQKVVGALAEKFNNGYAKIDPSVHDIARKIRLPGSLNENGGTKRYASVLESPDKPNPVPKDCLEKLAEESTEKKFPSLSGGKEERSELDMALEVIETEGDYYLDNIGRAFVDIMDNGHSVTNLVESKNFQIWVRLILKKKLGIKTLGTDFWTRVNGYLEALAYESGVVVDIRNRVSLDDGYISYDLQTPDYQMVCIDTEGVSIEMVPPKRFLRIDLDRPQVKPKLSVKSARLIPLLGKLFNFPLKEDLELFALWLVSCFVPDYEHPILWISGAQGSAKSTACSIIQELVSPQELKRSTFPRKLDDLVVYLSNRYISVFDNIGGISDDQSDILCQCVTNGTYTKRKLYTDKDMTAIPLRSIVVLNSCDTVINKPDLLSRVLHFNLNRIDPDELQPDNVIQQRIEKLIPDILGAIFDCIHKVIATDMQTDNIRYVIRLAQFQELATKIGSVLKMDADYVSYLLELNKQNVDIQILESNPVSFLIDNFMKRKEEWRGGVQDLYRELNNLAYKLDVDQRNKLYPKSAASLSQKLNGLESTLKRAGINFSIRNVGSHKEITLINCNLKDDGIGEEGEFEDGDELEFDEE